MVAKRIRTHLTTEVGDSPLPLGLRPKHLTKQEFGRRLYKLMIAKGWNQSDLARHATSYAKKHAGCGEVSRDNVSTYIRGTSLPLPDKLKSLAGCLDTTPEELLPNYVESAIDDDQPAFEMKVSTANPGLAWLRVNRLVRTATATAVAQLLEKDDVSATDGRGSGG